jgi:hypothetical protein
MASVETSFKPSTGYSSIEQEFEERTAKAFRSGADYVFIDSRRMRFQFEAAEYCHERGWLTEPEFVEIDEQYAQQRYRLTPAGKERWGI